MKRSLAIPAAIVLIIVAVAIALLKKDPEELATAEVEDKKEKPGAGQFSATGMSESGRSPRSTSQRTPSRSREGELVEQYGRGRTAQARQVSESMVSILDDVVAVGEMMMKGGQQFGGGRGGMINGLTRRMGIELNEEQQGKAKELYGEWQKAELEKSKKALTNLRDDPTAMMELFLAGDAKERGDMDEAEYSAVRDGAVDQLAGIINPLDRENFRGDRRMAGDDQLMNRFSEILDPEQAEKFSTYREEQGASNDQKPQSSGNITSMPTMELETLEKAVGSAQKMTTGFRSIVEGMGAMRELRPQTEPGSEGGQ